MDAEAKRLIRIAAALLLTSLSFASLDVGWRHPLAAVWAMGGLLVLGWPVLILIAGSRFWPTRRGAVKFGLAVLALGPLVPVVVGRGGAIFELSGLSLASFVVIPAVGILVVRTLAAHVRAEGAPFVVAVLVLVIPTAAMLWGEGTLIQVREGTEPLHLQLLVFAWGCCLGLVLPLALLLTRERPARGWVIWAGGAGGLLASGALLYADAVAMVGLYPSVHAWLQWMAGLMSMSGLGILGFWVEPRLGRKIGVAVLTASVLVVGGFALAGPVDDIVFRAAVARGNVGRALLRLRPRSRMPETTAPRDPRLEFDRLHATKVPANDFDVVLVTVDSLRADVFPYMPHLAELAAQSVVFERAYSPAPATYSSLPAILSGRHTGELDWGFWLVPRGGGAAVPVGEADRGERLHFDFFVLADAPEHGALAPRLRAAGLRTLAVVDGGISEFLRPATGFAVGFDRYEALPGSVRWPSSDAHVRRALAMLEEEQGERTFLWIHLFDPHRAERERDAYDRLLAETDQALGTFVDALRARGRWDRTILVLTADHGEAFGEHGATGHGSSLYEEQVRVPLIVRVPGVPPRVVTAPTSAIDAAPTIASLAGASLTGMTGVNLAPVVIEGDDRYPRDRVLFAEHLHYGPYTQRRLQDLKMVLRGDDKLIWDRRAEALELFDLGEDPAEASSVLWDRSDVAQSLRELLQSWSDDAEAVHPLP